jgi:hypothetical protein
MNLTTGSFILLNESFLTLKAYQYEAVYNDDLSFV